MNSLYITCTKCEKIFEVDKDLIPGLGRDVSVVLVIIYGFTNAKITI